jgi:hypothetical protein
MGRRWGQLNRPIKKRDGGGLTDPAMRQPERCRCCARSLAAWGDQASPHAAPAPLAISFYKGPRVLPAGLKVLALRPILAAWPSGLTAFRPGSSSPLNRSRLESRRSAPTGFTKSSTTAIGLSSAGTVPQCGSTGRNANDWTARLAAIAAAAELIKAKSFTIDGEAVVLGPDGLSLFEELSRREAADTAILYAFDLIERDGEDMRNRPFLDRKNALARLLRNTEASILFNEHIVEDGPVVFAHACLLGAEGIVSKKVDGTYRSGPCRVWIKVRNPASIAVQRERSEIWNRRA